MKTKIKFFILIAAFIGISNSTRAQFTLLHNFGDTIIDGNGPLGDLFLHDTSLYGMTYEGGVNGDGTIFKIKPDGTGYQDLLDFNQTNGSGPCGAFISDGTFLYGTTGYGGVYDFGTVFKIMPDGTGYVKLWDFGNTADGRLPHGSLFYDGTFLYGTTFNGGVNYKGTLFKIKTDGTGYVKLLDFAGTTNGSQPVGSLIYDGTFLYGTTEVGGANNMGVVFKIKTDGTSYSDLLDFAGTTNGISPHGSFFYDGTFLYGTTAGGGANNMGVIFKIMPDGTGFVKLLDFGGSISGIQPYGTLISEGSFLYGITSHGGVNDDGTIFKIKTDGTGYALLFDFSPIDGMGSEGSLISDGSFLYGMTRSGGTYIKGVVFKYALPSTVGVNALAINEKLEIYPNPTTGNFTITQNNTANTEIEIYDIVGELIYKTIATNQQTEIDLTKQAKGIYFVRIEDENKNIVNRKIVLQ